MVIYTLKFEFQRYGRPFLHSQMEGAPNREEERFCVMES